MNVLCVALLLSVCPATSAAAPRTGWPKEPRDFQGISFGGSFQEVETTLHEIGVDCPDSYYTESHGEPTWCHGALDFAGARVSSNFRFEKGKLVAVLLKYKSEAWADVKAILAARYGPPTRSSTDLLQNRMGASFKNEILLWHGKNVSLVASR